MLEYQKHLLELKYRIIYIIFAFIFTFTIINNYNTEILYTLITPILYLIKKNNIENLTLFKIIFTDIAELFFTLLKINIICSIYFILPFIIFQLYLFFIPGLYKFEKTRFINILFLILTFIYSNIYLIYKKILPLFIMFFLSYQPKYLNIQLNAKISEYLFFFININIIYFISCLIPLLLIYCLNNKLIKLNYILYYKKLFYFIMLIIYAFITPPDFFSLIIFTCPIILILESYLFFLLLKKKI